MAKKHRRSVSLYVNTDQLIDTSGKLKRPRKPSIKQGKTPTQKLNYHNKMVEYYHNMKQYHIGMYYSPSIYESTPKSKKKNKK